MQKNQESTVLNVYASKVILALWIMVIFLIVASLATHAIWFLFPNQELHWLFRFDLDAEANIPTYFSTIILLFSSFLLALIAFLKMKEQDPFRIHWIILSVLFLMISLDEAASLHDMLDRPLMFLLGGTSGFFIYPWVIMGALTVVLVAILFFSFWLHLPLRTRISFAVAAGIYVFGVIGLEAIGGPFVAVNDKIDLAYVFISTAEETLEMAGIVLFIKALLSYLSMFYSDTFIRIRFRQR